jgi:endonuclease/exonuclease/phosphatase (EEP) superfamily protein YafD
VILAAAAFSPYLMLGAPLAAIVFGLGRNWAATALALAVTVACGWGQAPTFIASAHPHPGSPSVTVMTANLRLGQADPDAVVRAAARHQVDVLMLQELTPSAVVGFTKAGLDQLLPYHVADSRPSAAGTGLWSRYPLADVVKRSDYTFALVTAELVIPGSSLRPAIAATHLPGPWPQDPRSWLRDVARLPELLKAMKYQRDPAGGPVIIGGDFNATLDVPQFRALLVDGYRDAAAQSGAGMVRTYPSDSGVPPLIGIDHIVVSSAVATSVQTLAVPGSDHRAVISRVVLG